MKAELSETHKKVHLQPLIKSWLENHKQVIAAREAKVEVAVISEFAVQFSRRSLEYLFGNLISNSLKYSSPNRKPEINISAQKEAPKVVVKVSDDGQEIDLKKHGGQLFKMFKRFHANVGPQGAGVDLFVVNQIVEKEGESIDIESKVDIGTIFTVEFPVVAA